MEQISPITRIRIKQVRLAAKICAKLAPAPGVGPIFRAIGRSDLCSKALVGFHTTFPSFEAAWRYADTYKVPSHEHPGNIATHLDCGARPSDYPLLFHMKNLLGEINSVVDIGGNAGNLFYCYDSYLKFGPNFSWTVNDVPQNNERGKKIAAERNEPRLHFVNQLSECGPVDVALISGALHYFQELPPAIMQPLKSKPRHVFINRTPVIHGETAITIQDARFYIAISPARILSRKTLMDSMQAANYELVDEWMVPDLHLHIPLRPESSANYYSGFYFRLRTA